MRPVLILLFALLLLAGPAQIARAEAGLALEPPVPGAVLEGFVEPVTRYAAGHRGVDLAASRGEPVVASAVGRVHFSGMVAGRGSVSIDHGNGLRTTYTPVRSSLAAGSVVRAGQVIGTVGTDAHCASRCLHWGLTDGTNYFDPLPYLALPRIRLLPAGWQPPPRQEFPPATTVPTGSGGGRPLDAPITSRYGMRVHPVTGVRKLHDGVDFGAACGTRVVTPFPGRVTQAEYHWAYGFRVIITHDGLRTAYAHLTGLEVQVGDQLPAGAPVGRVGNTGLSTGCHLHWMAWRGGSLIDPLTLASG